MYRDIMQILQDGAALHLGPMPGVIEDCAQMVSRVQGAEPHRPVQSGNHPPVQIFEQGSGQLAPYCRTHSLLLVHLVYQHYPMLPATVGTLFLTTPMCQALGRLEGKVCAQSFSKASLSSA